MIEQSQRRVNDLKKAFMLIEEIVPSIDKIGSGFSDSDTVGLVLLLFFKENLVLDKLANIRKIINNELSVKLRPEEYDELIEKDIPLWVPPYNKSKGEIINMIERVHD
ncbi:hypothetical protein KUA04_15540 [Proteus mirabilis]|uniref:hypothetical protein n=1 Tax=Proteus mirabilis TaxID=584 RepID=UPI001A2898AC|nr:hypothetical protein [Proteus mirabilis]MBI6279920.1 hypothetical protein [Proteus mirabilis]MCT0089846.1 hypothetical protein [Proteus mirabilis]HEK3221736.1 hypothetical protein [Proteus mirabilis]